eukprot:gene14090-29976_t
MVEIRSWIVIATVLIFLSSLSCIDSFRFRSLLTMTTTSSNINTLFDSPVSNHGARVRMIIKAKGIEKDFQVVSPITVGGMKSPDYLRLNPFGKMPVLVSVEGDSIPESDTIARYVLEKYSNINPSFIPSNISRKILSEKICRTHDIYISCIQGAMYKAPGTPFSIFGTNRSAALNELKNQLNIIENEINKFEITHPELKTTPHTFLCGPEITLADATLYPTVIFCMFMLPQFFGWKETDILGPRLIEWFNFMNTVPFAAEIKEEIEAPLRGWKESNRWAPIIEEMNKTSQ